MKKGSSIALLIIGGLYIYIMSDSGDYCGSRCGLGDGRAMASIFFIPLFIILSLNALFVTIIKWLADKTPYNYLPALTIFIVVTTYYSIHFFETSPLFESRTLYTAVRQGNYPTHDGTIELKQNKKFILTDNYGMAYCVFKGNYTIKNDTLKLLKDIYTLTDGDFNNAYYIDSTHMALIPIGNNGKLIWFRKKCFFIEKVGASPDAPFYSDTTNTISSVDVSLIGQEYPLNNIHDIGLLQQYNDIGAHRVIDNIAEAYMIEECQKDSDLLLLFVSLDNYHSSLYKILDTLYIKHVTSLETLKYLYCYKGLKRDMTLFGLFTKSTGPVPYYKPEKIWKLSSTTNKIELSDTNGVWYNSGEANRE